VHTGDSWTELHFVSFRFVSYGKKPATNALAKFRANLHNSENRDTGKEAKKVIKASWLKLLRKIESTQVEIFLDHHSLQRSMATKVIEPHFKILSQAIYHFYSTGTCKWNTYWPIFTKQVTERKMIQVTFSNRFRNSSSFISKFAQPQPHQKRVSVDLEARYLS
jgi:hypothetical protein